MFDLFDFTPVDYDPWAAGAEDKLQAPSKSPMSPRGGRPSAPAPGAITGTEALDWLHHPTLGDTSDTVARAKVGLREGGFMGNALAVPAVASLTAQKMAEGALAAPGMLYDAAHYAGELLKGEHPDIQTNPSEGIANAANVAQLLQGGTGNSLGAGWNPKALWEKLKGGAKTGAGAGAPPAPPVAPLQPPKGPTGWNLTTEAHLTNLLNSSKLAPGVTGPLAQIAAGGPEVAKKLLAQAPAGSPVAAIASHVLHQDALGPQGAFANAKPQAASAPNALAPPAVPSSPQSAAQLLGGSGVAGAAPALAPAPAPPVPSLKAALAPATAADPLVNVQIFGKTVQVPESQAKQLGMAYTQTPKAPALQTTASAPAAVAPAPALAPAFTPPAPANIPQTPTTTPQGQAVGGRVVAAPAAPGASIPASPTLASAPNKPSLWNPDAEAYLKHHLPMTLENDVTPLDAALALQKGTGLSQNTKQHLQQAMDLHNQGTGSGNWTPPAASAPVTSSFKFNLPIDPNDLHPEAKKFIADAKKFGIPESQQMYDIAWQTHKNAIASTGPSAAAPVPPTSISPTHNGWNQKAADYLHQEGWNVSSYSPAEAADALKKGVPALDLQTALQDALALHNGTGKTQAPVGTQTTPQLPKPPVVSLAPGGPPMGANASTNQWAPDALRHLKDQGYGFSAMNFTPGQAVVELLAPHKDPDWKDVFTQAINIHNQAPKPQSASQGSLTLGNLQGSKAVHPDWSPTAAAFLQNNHLAGNISPATVASGKFLSTPAGTKTYQEALKIQNGAPAAGVVPAPVGASATSTAPKPPTPQPSSPNIHPQLDENGNQVTIKNPHTPSGYNYIAGGANGQDPATFVPGGSQHPSLQPWSAPKDNVGWQAETLHNDQFSEPAFQPHPTKPAGSGVVILEPGGKGVWIVSPTNKFGGKENALPKGGLEPGLDLQANAHKEAFEESGLRVKLTDFIGDYETGYGKNRFYLGERIGGDPTKMGWESQAVHHVPLDKLDQFPFSSQEKKIIQDALAKAQGAKGSQGTFGGTLGNNPASTGTAPPAPPSWTKISGPTGTNPGGVYEDPAGTKHYVKFYQNPAQGQSEVLSSKISQLMGAPTVGHELDTINGKSAVKSRFNEDLDKVHHWSQLDASQKDQLARHFASAIITKNWDIVGKGLDNLKADSLTGDLVHTDAGGSFEFRAQGGHKAYGNDIGELKTLLDPNGPNPEAAMVFKQLGPDWRETALKAVKKLTPTNVLDAFQSQGMAGNLDHLWTPFWERVKALKTELETQIAVKGGGVGAVTTPIAPTPIIPTPKPPASSQSAANLLSTPAPPKPKSLLETIKTTGPFVAPKVTNPPIPFNPNQLSMDPKDIAARAKDQGVRRIGKNWLYFRGVSSGHGSYIASQQGWRSPVGKSLGEDAIFLAPQISESGNRGDKVVKNGYGSVVMPHLIKSEKTKTIDWKGKYWPSNTTFKPQIDAAWAQGYDTLLIKNVKDSGGGGIPYDQLMVKSPNQLRHPGAAFDPAFKASNNLLAARGAPLNLQPATGDQNDQNDQ